LRSILHGNPDQKLKKFGYFPGSNPNATREDVCSEIANAIQQIEKGDFEVIQDEDELEVHNSIDSHLPQQTVEEYLDTLGCTELTSIDSGLPKIRFDAPFPDVKEKDVAKEFYKHNPNVAGS
jgi:hypothetical protein